MDKKEEILKSYMKQYLNYTSAVNRSRIMTLITKQVLEDFPKNIPKEINDKLNEDTDILINYFANMVINKKTQKIPTFQSEIFPLVIELGFAETFDFNTYEKSSQLNPENISETKMSEIFDDEKLKNEKYKNMTIEQFFRQFYVEKDMSILEIYDGKTNDILKKAFNFDRILFSVEFVFLFANFEAFLIDSLKTVCQICPENMITNDKNYSKEDIISKGSWEEVLNFFIEDESFKLGKQPLEEKLKRFERFGIELDVLDINKSFITEINQIRNLIIHNGGIVNQEYRRKTGNLSIEVGSLVPLDSILLKETYIEFHKIAQGLFNIIYKKYLNS